MMKFALKHRLRKPAKRNTGSLSLTKNPLLILLHDIGGNEDVLFEMCKHFDERFLIVSLRGLFEQSPTSFAWFRISPFLDGGGIYSDDAEQSRLLVIQFIHEAIANYDIDASQVYLLGFGQGATVSLSVLLTEPTLVHGVVALSGLLLQETLHIKASDNLLKDSSVFLAYGLHDQVYPLQSARQTRDQLISLVGDLSYREFAIGHALSIQSINDGSAWLTKRLDSRKKIWFAGINSGLQFGHIQLKVRDLERSIAFYKRYLGFRVTERIGKAFAFLTCGYHHHDLVLQNVGPEAIDPPPNSLGMTSLAFEVVDQISFARVYRTLTDSGIETRTADKIISWSLYFFDPDRYEIEVYCDTRDLPGKADLWQGRDLPLETGDILALLPVEQETDHLSGS